MTPFVADPDFTLYVGDVRDVLRELPAESVHMCVTSPPYWGLRDYGTEGQIGLEPTPEAFVAALVDVFREVRRVLRDDGTLWLNLGDSYANPGHYKGNAGDHGTIGRPRQADEELGGEKLYSKAWPGAKNKDLIGIPWRVAFALQQPYYTGTIKDERDRIWLAAMVEAEGCLFIHKRKAGQSNGQGYERKNDSYGAGLEVASTDRAIVERCLAIAGKGSIGTVERGSDARRRQTLYRWMLRSNECRGIVTELYPHFVAKHHEARLLLGCPSSGEDAARAHESLKAIHQGDPPTIDFPAPPSLFEPGWYLRSDVIWSKANPMPESVTDRPTKAHEYLFLLSKQPRYFFDQEAVREEWTSGRDDMRAKGVRTGLAYLQQGTGAYSNHDKPTLDGSEGEGPRGPDGRRATKVEGRDGSLQHRDGERWPNGGRNIRSVWEIATQPYPEAHFATFPEALPDRCIRAGSSERGCCPECGAPWVRLVKREDHGFADRTFRSPHRTDTPGMTNGQGATTLAKIVTRDTQGWRPACECHKTEGEGVREAGSSPSAVPCTVLDPFMGSATTALVARRLGRRSIGIELNEEYARLAARRLQQQSLFAGDAA